MAGILTKSLISGVLLALILTVGFYFMTSLGDSYDSSISDGFATQSGDTYQNTMQSTVATYDKSQDAASIDAQSLGAAQLQGLISSEQQTKSSFGIFITAVNDFARIYNFHPAFIWAIISIFTILAGAGIYYMLRGVLP